MTLKNYTSSVPAAQTISYIEAYLSECGMVSGIAKEIKGGVPVSLLFRAEVGDKTFTVRLPARVDDVHDFLWRDYVSHVSKPRKVKADFLDQASRTAWKIQQDWVQVQMSMIKLKQAEFLQVFMAYIWDGQQTYYEFIKGNQFKALPESTS